MKEMDATEEAYKNGYKEGVIDCIEEIKNIQYANYKKYGNNMQGLGISQFNEIINKLLKENK